MPQTISPWQILTSDEKYLEREKSSECTTEVRIAAADLAERVSNLLDELGRTAHVSSGFRTRSSNQAVGGVQLSAHQSGQAVDLEDPDGSLAFAINRDPGLLTRYDLYMEHTGFTYTKTGRWVHLTTRPKKSGRRIFIP